MKLKVELQKDMKVESATNGECVVIDVPNAREIFLPKIEVMAEDQGRIMADAVMEVPVIDKAIIKRDIVSYLCEYMESFLSQNDWSDEYAPEQARSVFTTICLIGSIDADTKECDDILGEIYWRAGLDRVIEFEEYINYMLALIV